MGRAQVATTARHHQSAGLVEAVPFAGIGVFALAAVLPLFAGVGVVAGAGASEAVTVVGFVSSQPASQSEARVAITAIRRMGDPFVRIGPAGPIRGRPA